MLETQAWEVRNAVVAVGGNDDDRRLACIDAPVARSEVTVTDHVTVPVTCGPSRDDDSMAFHGTSRKFSR